MPSILGLQRLRPMLSFAWLLLLSMTAFARSTNDDRDALAPPAIWHRQCFDLPDELVPRHPTKYIAFQIVATAIRSQPKPKKWSFIHFQSIITWPGQVWTRVRSHFPAPLRLVPATDADRPAIYQMTYQEYRDKKYVGTDWNPATDHFPGFQDLPQTITLVVKQGHTIVGTISVTINGPRGLPYDQEFGSAIHEWGQANDLHRTGAVWRFVVPKEYRRDARISRLLMKGAYQFFKKHRVDGAILVVHPSRSKLYQRLFGMKEIARSREMAGMAQAPGALLVRVVREFQRDKAGAHGKSLLRVKPSHAPRMRVAVTAA